MAFDKTQLALISSVNGFGLYRYDTLDFVATVIASGYINNLDDSQNLAIGDQIEIFVWTTAVRTGVIADVGRATVTTIIAANAVALTQFGGGGGGETNTSSNVGGGSGLANAKVGVDLPFKSLVAGTNVTLTPAADTVTIAASGGGSTTWVGLTDTPGSITARGIPTGNLAGNALELVAGGTVGQVLTSGGAGVLPTFQTNSALSGQWERIGSIITASSDASIDFVLTAGHREFRVRLLNVAPSINDRILVFQLSNDGGSTFIAGAGYKNAVQGNRSGGTTHNEGNVGNNSFRLTLGVLLNLGVGNDTNEDVSGEVHIMNPLSATEATRYRSHLQYEDATVAEVEVTAGGAHQTIETHDAISIFFETGLVASGELILEGLLT